MSEKMLFFLLHFIGVGATIIGSFISVHLLISGVTLIAINAIIMGLRCDIKFK